MFDADKNWKKTIKNETKKNTELLSVNKLHICAIVPSF